MIQKILKSPYFILVLIIISSGFLFRSSFNAYFFQDDWFSLTISRVSKFKELLAFFIPRTDVIYYRPLGMQLPFFILNSLFGLNQFYYHLTTFVTHALNIILVYFLVKSIVQNKRIALLSAFFYGTSSVHFIPFYWFSTYAFVSGPTFFLLAFIFYWNSRWGLIKKYYFTSILLFFLGVLVNEMVTILPLIITLVLFHYKKLRNIKSLLPFYFIVLVLFSLRFLYFTPPSHGLYSLGIGKHILSNYKTYFLWSFNWSEILTEQMINFFQYTSAVSKHFTGQVITTSILFIINALILLVLPAVYFLKNKFRKNVKQNIAYILWFLIGLLPVVIFSAHKFPYYLPISIIGLFIALSEFLLKTFNYANFSKKIRLIIIILLISTYYLSSLNTVGFNSLQHWAPQRARIAEGFVTKAVKSNYLEPKIYVGDSSESKLALNDQDAFKLIFGWDFQTIYSNREN